MDFRLELIGAGAALLLASYWYGSTTRRREIEAYRFIERIGLPMTDPVHVRVDRRLRKRSLGSTIGALVALLVYALLFAFTPDFWPIGVAGASSTGIIAAALALGGAASALGQFTPPQPDAPRFARADAPGLTDYVHPGWLIGAAVLAALSVAPAGAILVGIHPTAPHIGLPLAAVSVLAVLAVAGIVTATALSSTLLAVPQPASSELELQWDDALRAYALRDLWFASIALSSAAFVTGFAWFFDDSSPYIFVGALVGLAPLVLLTLPVSRRPLWRLWQSSAHR